MVANVQKFRGNPTIPLLGASWYASQIFDFCPIQNPGTQQVRIYCTGMASPVATGVQSIGLFTDTLSNLTNGTFAPTEYNGAGNGQLLTANATGWEHSTLGPFGIRLGTVLYVGGTWYMWYTGYGDGSGGAIGLATSTDGLSWTKYASNPVLAHDTNDANCKNPAVVWDGTYFWMVYGGDSGGTLYGYRAARSTDGINWTKLSGTGFVLGGTGTAYYEWHSLWAAEGAYLLSFERGSPASTSATWTNNLAWCRNPYGPYVEVGYNPILFGSGAGAWDQDHEATPNVFVPSAGSNPVCFFCGSNDNIPTSGNTNYNNNQWPGGMGTLLGYPTQTNIWQLASPSLCARRCALTIKGSTGSPSNVQETNTYAVCFGGSGNTETGLVSRLPDDLFLRCQSDGGDICFSSDSAGQTQLSADVVWVNTSAKQAEIWVSIPLTAGSDTTIYVWYQSVSGWLGQPVYSGVWGNYTAVYHFQSLTQDSSGNNNTGANTGVTQAQGEIGQGAVYGTNNYLQLPAINCDTTAGCVSWWTKPNTAYNDGSVQIFGWSQQPSSSPFTPAFSAQKFSDSNFYIGFQSSTTNYRLTLSASAFWTQNVWNRYDYVWNGSGQWLYWNGALANHSTTVPSPQNSGTSFNLALQNLGSTKNYFNGSQDEFRISTVAPSAAWLATDYNIQTNNVTSNPHPLVVVGTPQGVGLPNYSAPGLGPPIAGAPWAATMRSSLGYYDLHPLAITALALAAQSATWTNPALALLQSLSLGAESAAWTDPAISLESLLSLAVESAAWTDPGLALSSSLALGAESATWANPALAQAVALALAGQSATWTNPGIAIPGSSLNLAVQSASWVNPALSLASSLALAAESAGWSNPALNAAAVLALTGQSATWNNPALTPSGSQGLVLQLPAQSAIWTAAPLGLFYCPTILNPYFGLEWLVVVPGLPALAKESCVISNTEVVTLYRKLSDGSFDGGTLVGQALRLDDHKALIGGGKGMLKRNELQWYLWKSQTGGPEVKSGDVIQDALGNRWTVWSAEVQAWGNRFLVQTKLENVNLQ